MLLDFTEGVGAVAGALGAFASMPQAIKIVRERRADGVSGVTYLMMASAGGLWVLYGVYRGAPSIVVWNMVWTLICTAVLALKLRMGKR
jgi:MtN3 and saliva related transmembrane protein